MTAVLRALRDRGVLSALDGHFARTMARLGGDGRDAVVLAAALASRQVGQGHVCLDLGRLCDGPPLVDEAGSAVEPSAWPALPAWLEALRDSPLVGASDGGGGLTPLVLDGRGRLYLRRYWEYERRLVAAIRARAGRVDPGVDLDLLRGGLRRLFPTPAAGDEPDWQRVAAFAAVRRGFCVVSGGPGTGKTFTVAKILALLIEQALRHGGRAPRILLLAPTGKAAARLGESIAAARDRLDCDEAVRAHVPSGAATIHRALGARPGRVRTRHGQDEPLRADVVLVDEASMIDLALMARLTDALPAAARLILLGDQDQLASVEAGAILGDICNSGVPRRYSRGFVDEIAACCGDRLPADADAPAETGIWDCIVQLTRSYRYPAESRIGRLAHAINAGSGDAVLAAFAPASEVERRDPVPADDLGPRLRDQLERGLRGYAQSTDARPRLDALARFRVLCAHRRGPAGVETLNRLIETELRERGVLRGGEPFYVGRPLLVTRNDYQVGLFNGDVGLVVDDRQRPGGRLAYFLSGDGRERQLSPARLPECETVFAMTVHKSQGSEFDEVAVVLPERESPVVTRELLYTAVTRARARVAVYASEAVLRRAVGQRVERASGLRDGLWGG